MTGKSRSSGVRKNHFRTMVQASYHQWILHIVDDILMKSGFNCLKVSPHGLLISCKGGE